MSASDFAAPIVAHGCALASRRLGAPRDTAPSQRRRRRRRPSQRRWRASLDQLARNQSPPPLASGWCEKFDYLAQQQQQQQAATTKITQQEQQESSFPGALSALATPSLSSSPLSNDASAASCRQSGKGAPTNATKLSKSGNVCASKNLFARQVSSLMALISCLALVAQESRARPVSSSFLDSGSPISCTSGSIVHIYDIIQNAPAGLERCYTCHCPAGTVLCDKTNDAPECQQQFLASSSSSSSGSSTTRMRQSAASRQQQARPHNNNHNNNPHQHHNHQAPNHHHHQHQHLPRVRGESSTRVHHDYGKQAAKNRGARVPTSAAAAAAHSLPPGGPAIVQSSNGGNAPSAQPSVAPARKSNSARQAERHAPIAQPIGGVQTTTVATLSRRPMVRTTASETSRQLQANAARKLQRPAASHLSTGSENIEPVMVGGDDEDDEDEKVEEEQRRRQQAINLSARQQPERRAHFEDMLRPLAIPADDPRHEQNAASALGEHFLRKRERNLQVLSARKTASSKPTTTTTTTSTTTTTTSTTTPPPPPTTTVIASTTVSEHLDSEQEALGVQVDKTLAADVTGEEERDDEDGPGLQLTDDDGDEPMRSGDEDEEQNVTAMWPTSGDVQPTSAEESDKPSTMAPSVAPASGQTPTLEYQQPTATPTTTPTTTTTPPPQTPQLSATTQTTIVSLIEDNRLDTKHQEATSSGEQLMEQVSNEAMLYIAMGIEATILLVILAMMVIIYVYRERPLEEAAAAAAVAAEAASDASVSSMGRLEKAGAHSEDDLSSSSSSELSASSCKKLTSFRQQHFSSRRHLLLMPPPSCPAAAAVLEPTNNGAPS